MNLGCYSVLLLVGFVFVALLIITCVRAAHDPMEQLEQTWDEGMQKADQASDTVRNDIQRILRR